MPWPQAQRRLVALLAPVLLWDLGLQTWRLIDRFPAITRDAATMNQLDWLGLLYSPLCYHAGLALICAGLVLWSKGPVGLLLAQFLALFTLLQETAAYSYFMHTGSPLEFGHVRYWLGRPRDLAVVATLISPRSAAEVALAFGVLVALPWIAGRRGPEHGVRRRHAVAMALAGAMVAAFGLFPSTTHAADLAVVRDPVLELAATATEGPPPPPPRMVRTLEIAGKAVPYNVVMVMLESTRAMSVPPWGAGAPMPFLESLAHKGLTIERMYTAMPHTAKALVALLCGLEPAHTVEQMSMKTGLLDRCIPELLKEQGWSTVFFQSANPNFEGRRAVVKEMEFQEFHAPDTFDLRGYEKANFVGWEDEVMLPASKAWLAAHATKPFFAAYLTSSPHHEVEPLHRHGYLFLSPDKAVNNYLNALRTEDYFLQGLVEQYRELGLLDRTLFVILGDHGEGFGEHGRSAHDVVPYEEALRVPFVMWDPSGRLVKPGKLQGPVSQVDLMPTLLELLGFEVVKGKLAGKNFFTRPPLEPVYAACYADRECIMRVGERMKLIHWYNKRPDELYDLRADPGETKNLAAERPQQLRELLADLQHWDTRVRAVYWGDGMFTRKWQ